MGDTPQSGTVRQRTVGGGRKGQGRTAAQKVLFILVYQKASPLQTLLGAGCELSQPRVTYGGPCLLPVLQQARAGLALMPARRPSQFAHPERGNKAPRELSIDGPERRRQRPQSPEKQALPYRGKRKTHRDKHVVGGNAQTKRGGYLRQPYAGKTPDKKSADHEALGYPRAAILDRPPAFRAMHHQAGKPGSPKKAAQRSLVEE